MTKTEILYNVPNEKYHGEWLGYISSTKLKKYATSPMAYKDSLDAKNKPTDGMKFGTVWHDLMEAKHIDNVGGHNYIGYEPKINAKTGKPYGADTAEQMNNFMQFKQENEGKQVVGIDDLNKANTMVDLIFNENIENKFRQPFLAMFKCGKTEVSYLTSNYSEGVHIKTRKDLDGVDYIIDYKTTARSLNDFIWDIKDYGYDISAAMYVLNKKLALMDQGYNFHDLDIKWYWFVQETKAPYDFALISGQEFLEVGMKKFDKLMAAHIDCTRKNSWPGVGYWSEGRVMKFNVPNTFNYLTNYL